MVYLREDYLAGGAYEWISSLFSQDLDKTAALLAGGQNGRTRLRRQWLGRDPQSRMAIESKGAEVFTSPHPASVSEGARTLTTRISFAA